MWADSKLFEIIAIEFISDKLIWNKYHIKRIDIKNILCP